MEEYLSALIRNMENIRPAAENYRVDSVFFGGGSPSLLSGRQMARVMAAVRQNFTLDGDAEITVESNPATVTPATLKQYRGAGVSRLSIGLQSADAGELERLSRIHTPADSLSAFRAARAAGFDNINIDLMYGIPGQTYAHFMHTLDFVAGLAPEHLSVYALRIEAGTPLAARDEAALDLPSEEEVCRMYLDGVELLREKGYGQYEISNFAKPGYECRHNLKYWNCESYIGLGPSAHSYFRGERYAYCSDLQAYCAAFSPGAHGANLFKERSVITKEESEKEYIMLRLRLAAGISVREFSDRFGKDFEAHYAPRLKPFIRAGLACHADGRYALTPRGMLVSNSILCELVDF